MKKTITILVKLLSLLVIFQSCNDFEEINENPLAANTDQVQIEYFINNSIIGTQQNPHVAERAFILYWKAAGRMDRINTLPAGRHDDGWSTDYFKSLSTWLGNANTAIQVADDKEKEGKTEPYSNNLKQVARIWRAYLMSEMSDQFGPMPIDGFKGKNPDFNSVEEVYDFILEELKDAVSKINEQEQVTDRVKKLDPAYSYDFKKWKLYGNSLRMRLAMRISGVAPSKAKEHFEEAVKGGYIKSLDQIFAVQEKSGWNDLTGVMSREWNMQYISATLSNLYTGLGSVSSKSQLPDSLHKYVKDESWLGIKYEKQFATKTNNPVAGYWFDGLPAKIDPRAYQTFIIPGWLQNKEYNKYPSWAPDLTKDTKQPLLKNKKDTLVKIDAAYTWNASSLGSWGDKGSLNKLYNYPACTPRLANKFRNSSSKRIFFASWESYFLISEAAEKGWNIPLSGKEAYEKGIEESFNYWGVSKFYQSYITSNDYNRAGTSVAWEHTTEPQPMSMQYKDGYTGGDKSIIYTYPKNGLYKNGAVKNDRLTKIITQKFIAQTPWLPLETWSDHRRLGLPFFENPAVEKNIITLPALTESNYMESRIEFFPQRIPYPSFLSNNVPEGYKQALNLLNGDDKVLTPLWWAQQPK